MRHYSAPEARVGYSIRFAAALIMVVLTATPGRGLSVETQPSEAHGKVASPLGVAGDNERQSEALKGTTASWSDNVLKEGSIDSSIAAHMELEPPAQGQFTAHSDKSGHDKPWPTGIPRVSPGNQTMIEAAAEGDPVDIYLSRCAVAPPPLRAPCIPPAVATDACAARAGAWVQRSARIVQPAGT